MQKLAAHIERRLQKERWRSAHQGHPFTPPKDFKPKSLTTPAAISLHDAVKMVILPATVVEQCSLVELMATGPQEPRWFCSHRWGEAVIEFVACITQHAKDRKLVKGAASYWT